MSIARLMAVLNHDFCPNANRFVYWLKHPLAILGFALFVSLACALCLNPQAFAAVGGLVVVVAVGLFWPAVALRGLTSTIHWERNRCREGETVRARLSVRNRFPWPVWGLTLEGGFRTEAPIVALARVAGFADVEFVWEFTPQQRGVYPLQTPLLSTGFPFGLWQARRVCSVVQSLVVWPSTTPLDMLPDLTESRVSEDRTTDRRAGDSGDMLGTRPFRQGDSLRRIHWAQSARHQRLIVTERQAGVEGAVCVVVDIAAEHHDGPGKDSSFEWTLRMAASICECLLDGHLHVECVLGDERFVLNGSHSLRQLMDRMAKLPEGGVGCDSIATRPLRLQSQRPINSGSGSETNSETAKGSRWNRNLRSDCVIHCTTDLGWHATHGRTTRREQRAVVMKARAQAQVATREVEHHEHDCVMSVPFSAAAAGTRTTAARPWVQIDSNEDVPNVFRQQWRRACRVA